MNTSIGIEHSLRQAEMQNLELEMTLNFQKNLSMLKERVPQLYDQFVSYQAERYTVVLEEDGYVDLLELSTNKRYYGEHPVETARDQFEIFKKAPGLMRLTPQLEVVRRRQHYETEFSNEVLRQVNDQPAVHENIQERPIGVLVVHGLGLGYHINTILESLAVDNLLLFEAERDFFFWSLHLLDWTKIIEHYTAPGRTINFFIGTTIENTLVGAKMASNFYGPHLSTLTFNWFHGAGGAIDKAYLAFKQSFHLSTFGLGYVGDEQIGFAHSLENMSRQPKLFSGVNEFDNDWPVFVVGNGPSLDEQVDFLRLNQDRAIIIACGTAISSLYQVGIKPDFYIEMERLKESIDFIKQGTTDEFREGIRAFGFNTVHPEVFELFDDYGIFLKANDTGSLVCQLAAAPEILQNTPFSNPTVTNLGTAVAASLNFKEVILLGVDLGTKEYGVHHSGLSQYKKDETLNQQQTDRFFEQSYEVAGNKGGPIVTNMILDESRQVMQTLIAAVPESAFYNPSDGAFIKGAKPCDVNDLNHLFPPSKSEKKEAFIERLMDAAFVTVKTEHKATSRKYLQKLLSSRKAFKLPETVKSDKELYSLIKELFETSRNTSSLGPVGSSIIQGSTGMWLQLFYRFCFLMPEGVRDENYRIIRKGFNKAIAEHFSVLREHAGDLDDSFKQLDSVVQTT